VSTKPVDQATPKLYNALIKNEVLTEVTSKFWQPSAGPAGPGAEQQYFTIELTNAHIAEIAFVSADHAVWPWLSCSENPPALVNS
jgi:type VI secretion system secreted protein Hcp